MKYAVPEDHPFAEHLLGSGDAHRSQHEHFPRRHSGASLPGPRFGAPPSPIRAQRIDRFKSEGWATYWEETALQLGFYDERPRSRELLYNFLRLRALRVIVDVKMALGEMTAQEGAAALMSVPMDARTASEEADDFFAAPTGGTVYQIGKMQIERLLGERQRQLGAQFNLRQFHDDVVNAAWVPLELTRWEMTGESANARTHARGSITHAASCSRAGRGSARCGRRQGGGSYLCVVLRRLPRREAGGCERALIARRALDAGGC